MPLRPAVQQPRARRARWRRAVRLVFAGSVGLAAAGHAADARAATTPPFAIELDRSTAMFQLTNLRPGPIGSRCLLVSVRNGLADNAVLSATVGGTGLADYLDLQVEVGTSADPATCTDFTGTVAFVGTVADLGVQHPDPATGVPLPLAGQTSAVVRFTLDLRSDNAAMGRTATLTFRFDAQDVTGAPPTTTTPTTVPATTTVTTVGPAPTSAARTVDTTGPTTTTPASTTTAPASTTTTAGPTTTAARTTRTTRIGGGAGAGSGTTAVTAPRTGGEVEVVVTDPTREPQPANVVTRAVEAVTQTATTAAKTSTVPATFLSFVALFLVLQDRFDRNDPKLARAPLAPEPEMVFQPRRGGVRP